MGKARRPGARRLPGWAEPLGFDPRRLVAKLHHYPSGCFDERGRATDVDVRLERWGGRDLGEHVRVDPPREASPSSRL